jgi:hypothetical protein
LSLHPTDNQLAKLHERTNALRRKISTWIQIQQAYMPGASVLRLQGERLKCPANSSDIEPEDIDLWFPSAVGRRANCSDQLYEYEWAHRIAQANDALNEIRDNLHLRSHLYKFKDSFTRGQKANTRSRSTIQGVQDKIDASVRKYQIAHQALVKLAPILGESGWDTVLKPLDAHEDVRGLSEAGYDQSEGRRKLSWIWLCPGITLDKNEQEGDKHAYDGK